MKAMNRILLLVMVIFALTVFAATPAMAQVVSTSGLTDTQKAELALQAAKMRDGADSSANISEVIRNEASQWGELGANMGKALVGAAKEVGVAANEFAATPLGKVTVAVVAYKIIGKDLLGVVIGVVILIVGYSLGIYFLCFGKIGYEVKYETKRTLFGLMNRRYVISKCAISDSVAANFIIGLLGMALATLVSISCIL